VIIVKNMCRYLIAANVKLVHHVWVKVIDKFTIIFMHDIISAIVV
jgi:hypothetical protein